MSKTHYVLGVTPTQRKNLEQLYEHLGKVEKIDMALFAVGSDGVRLELDELVEEISEKNVCGTVCCLAGNGPAAGIKPRRGEVWDDYTTRVFGAHFRTGVGERIWEWLFDGSWQYVDNTVEGGRARLRIALDQGIPVDYVEQQLGRAPLSYKVTA